MKRTRRTWSPLERWWSRLPLMMSNMQSWKSPTIQVMSSRSPLAKIEFHLFFKIYVTLQTYGQVPTEPRMLLSLIMRVSYSLTVLAWTSFILLYIVVCDCFILFHACTFLLEYLFYASYTFAVIEFDRVLDKSFCTTNGYAIYPFVVQKLR